MSLISTMIKTYKSNNLNKNKIDKLVNSITDNQYNINVYDMYINNVSMAIQDALTPPFLSDNKVVIIKNPLFLTKTKMEIEHNIDMLINYLDNVEETTYLIIDAGGLKVDENTDTTMSINKIVCLRNLFIFLLHSFIVYQ